MDEVKNRSEEIWFRRSCMRGELIERLVGELEVENIISIMLDFMEEVFIYREESREKGGIGGLREKIKELEKMKGEENG